jgi:hypothetical protein
VSVAVVGLTKIQIPKKVDATELAQFEAWKASSLQKELEKENAVVAKPATKVNSETCRKLPESKMVI